MFYVDCVFSPFLSASKLVLSLERKYNKDAPKAREKLASLYNIPSKNMFHF